LEDGLCCALPIHGLIPHQLDGAGYRVIATLSGQTKAKSPSIDAIELDLAYILGD
jgi:hypothetical protein